MSVSWVFSHDNVSWTHSIKCSGREVGKRKRNWERARARVRKEGENHRGRENEKEIKGGGRAVTLPEPVEASGLPMELLPRVPEKNG